jgi:hypothetical protein
MPLVPGSGNEIVIRISEKKAKKYSKKRVLEKLFLGELSPEDEAMGVDGYWRPLKLTPGFRKFCENLLENRTKKKLVKPQSPQINIGEIIQKSAVSSNDSVWDGFKLDEQIELPTGKGGIPLKGSSVEISLPIKSKKPVVQPVSVQPIKEKLTKEILANLLPPGANEEEDSSKGYGMVVERESKIARIMRKKVTKSYTKERKENNIIWIEGLLKWAMLAVFLLVAFFAGPTLMDKAYVYWDKKREFKSQSKELSGQKSEISQPNAPNEAPGAIRK